MKIKNIQGYVLSSSFSGISYLGYQNRKYKNIGVIEIETDNNLKGFGETYAGVYCAELISPIIDFLRRFIINKQIENTKDIKKITEGIFSIPYVGRTGLLSSISSGINIALYDLLGKFCNLPVYKILSKDPKKKSKVYASNGSSTLTPQEIYEDVKLILDNGYDSYKMRIGLQNWNEDIKRITKARNLLDKNNLMLDAIMGTINPPWNINIANKNLEDVHAFDPYWIEEPLHPTNIEGMKKLNTKYKIAGGEALSNFFEFNVYKQNKCVTFIQPDVTHSGGYDVCKKIIKNFYPLKTALHVWGSALAFVANLHLSLSSKVHILEMPLMKLDIDKDILVEKIIMNNGFILAPQSPGLGINISDNIKKKYSLIENSNYTL